MPQTMVAPLPNDFNDMDVTIMKLFAALKEKDAASQAPQGQPPFQPTTPEQDVFNQGDAAISAMQPPTPGGVPGSPSPLASFLSQLAGNLGSALSENPTYGQNVTNTLNARREATSSAESANEQQRSQFEQKREEMRLQNRLKFAEAQSKRAIETNDRQAYRDAEELKLRVQNRMDAMKAGASSAELDKRLKSEQDIAAGRNATDIAVQGMRNKGDLAVQAERNKADTAVGNSANEDVKLKDFMAEENKRFGGGDPIKKDWFGSTKVDDEALAEQLRFYSASRRANKAGKIKDYIDARMDTMLRMKFGDLEDPDNLAKAKAWLDKRGIK